MLVKHGNARTTAPLLSYHLTNARISLKVIIFKARPCF